MTLTLQHERTATEWTDEHARPDEQVRSWHAHRAPTVGHQMAGHPITLPRPSVTERPEPAYLSNAPAYPAGTAYRSPSPTAYQHWTGQAHSVHRAAEPLHRAPAPQPWSSWFAGLTGLTQAALVCCIGGLALIFVGAATAAITAGTKGFLFTFFGAALVYGGFKLAAELNQRSRR